MKECPNCAVDIPDRAAECPICKYDFPRRPIFPWKPVAVILLLIIGITLLWRVIPMIRSL